MEKAPKLKIETHVGAIGEAFAREHLEKKGYDVCKFGFPAPLGPLHLCKHIKCIKKIDITKCRHRFIKTDGKLGEFCYEYAGIPPCPCSNLYPRICDECDCNPCLVRNILLIEDNLRKKFDRVFLDQLIDFLAHKDGRHYFVEVKTNRATLDKFQREFLAEGRKIGFEPIVIRVYLDLKHAIEEE